MGSNKHPKDEGQEPPEINVSHAIDSFIINKESPNQVTVNPREQKHLSLGSFTETNQPKGFSVGLVPNPDPIGAVVTKITSMGTADRYELILYIANYGSKPVTAKIWQL
jgi:hypothetical protein